MAPVLASGNVGSLSFLMTFGLVCSSHLRSRLTDQGESYHFGGYADIRVLANAFLLFTAARFSQSRLERSKDLSVSLIS
jgi:hypothetical protein